MRIALNATALLSPLTGIGQYTQQLAQGLSQRSDVELALFYGTSWERHLRTAGGTAVVTLKSWLSRHIPNSYDLGRLVKQQRFNRGMRETGAQLYHEPNFLAFKSNKPTVITVHDLSWIRFPQAHPADRVRNMNRYFEGALRRADLVITDSYFVQRELEQVFGVPASRITPIALGVEPLFHPRSCAETAATLATLGLVHGQYLLAVGTLEPRKNLTSALRAFAALPQADRLRHPLVIAGMKGWHTSALEQQMAPMLAAGEIRLLGYLEREALAIVTAGALALVYPSIYEGFGLPPLEAMACAVPVIASNVSSLPEVIGDTGILIDQPEDIDALRSALRRLIDDTQHRDALASLALARAGKFSWDATVEQTVQAYRRIL